MPSAQNLTIDAARHVGRMTLKVRVRGARRVGVRIWLAGIWLRIGAWLIGCKFSIDSGGDD